MMTTLSLLQTPANTLKPRLPIIVVEDSPQWQTAFNVLLSQYPDEFDLLGIAENKASTIALLKNAPYHPRDIVVVLDWELPENETGWSVFETLSALLGVDASQVLLVSATPAHQLPILPFEQLPKTKAGQQLVPTLLARWEQFQRFHVVDDGEQQATA